MIHSRDSVAHNAERETHGPGGQHVPCERLSIKSDITPETLDVMHYPAGEGKQTHFHIRQDVRGMSVYMTQADALLVRDFLLQMYPADRYPVHNPDHMAGHAAGQSAAERIRRGA